MTPEPRWIQGKPLDIDFVHESGEGDALADVFFGG